jgi:hypothetical protein
MLFEVPMCLLNNGKDEVQLNFYTLKYVVDNTDE